MTFLSSLLVAALVVGWSGPVAASYEVVSMSGNQTTNQTIADDDLAQTYVPTVVPTPTPTIVPIGVPTLTKVPTMTKVPTLTKVPTTNKPTTDDKDDDESGSCGDARSEKDSAAQCDIAKSDDCDNDYAVAYYCSASWSKPLLAVLYLVWMVVLFVLLGSTADEYFSPALEQLSQDAGLPPRFAGVTLLALGNGAPDVSSTMHAVSSSRQGYRLALGSLTGAGMFVGTVVAGAVMVYGKGAKAKGALLRDVSAYLCACSVIVGVMTGIGHVGYTEVTIFLTCYAAFVGIVLAADLWHRRPGGPADQLARSGGTLDDDDDPRAVELLLTLLHSVRRPDHGGAHKDDEDEIGFEAMERNPLPQASDEQRGYVVIDGDAASGPFVNGGQSAIDSDTFSQSLLADNDDDDKEPNDSLIGEIWDHCKDHVNEVMEMSLKDKILAIPELPFVLVRRATVPLTSDDSYARGPLVLSCVGAPLWLCVYFWSNGSDAAVSPAVLVPALVVGCVMAFAVYIKTQSGPLPKAPALALALFGFAVAATWIDVFADQLVGTLQFYGALVGIPETALGLTVLAMGNSVGDFSTNIAMAKKGLANMAITACFAGPVFNALVGLGLGFSQRLAKLKVSQVDASINTSLYVGFAAIGINCIALLVVGIANRNFIPPAFGYFSIALYVAYLTTSLTVIFAAS